MRAKGLDAMLITGPENRRYLSGFSADDLALDESAGALLVLANEAIVLTDGRYRLQAESEATGWQVRVYKKGLHEALKTITAQASVKTIGYEPRYMTCERLEAIQKAISDIELLALSGKVEQLRVIKDKDEVKSIQRAVDVAESVLKQVVSELRPGMTEKAICWRILEGLYRASEGPSFPPIVASGPNAALPHAVPTDRQVMPGEPIIIDMGAKVNGYCSDMTRTVFLGRPKDRILEIFRVVRAAQEAAQKAVSPTMTGQEVDKVARSIISRAGYGSYFVHGLGHGVGLQVHEAPALSPRNRKRLKAGMVATVEPGIYLPNEGGVRLENMVLVTDSGAQALNKLDWLCEIC